MVDTTYFPVGQLFAQMGLACLGWAFVNIVTLRRTDPFTSGNGSHSAFKKLLWIVPIVFMYSTINTQRQSHDLAGYCNSTANANGFHHHESTNTPIFLNDGIKDAHQFKTNDGVIMLNKHHGLRAGHEPESDNSL